MQEDENLKVHYLEMLPLSNASQSNIDALKFLETEVSNLVRMCKLLYFQFHTLK